MSMSTSDNPSVSKQSSLRPLNSLYALWRGQGKAAKRHGSLVWGMMLLILAAFAYRGALASLAWIQPFKLIGGAMVIGALTFFGWGIYLIINAIIRIGVRGLFVRVVIIAIVAILVTGILLPSDYQGVAHWWASTQRVVDWVSSRAIENANTILSAPDTLLFAATGHRRPAPIPDPIPTEQTFTLYVSGTVVLPNTFWSPPDTTSVAAPQTDSQHPQALSIGAVARVAGTDGQVLRARAQPSVNAAIVARFPANSLLTIIDGPRTSDGQVWWRVRGKEGEGWCAASFLEPATQ